jgi:hypothetical protein
MVMKAVVTILALALAAPALAQGHDHGAMAPAAPAAPAAPTAPTATAKFGLDTPIEQIAADPKGKAVIDADLPGVTTHQAYDMFKSMSLNQLMPMSQGKITPELLVKVQADLAAIK